MKRMLKKGVFLLVALLLVLSLTGCQMLDDMKAAQGFFLNNGNILYGDVEYTLLPGSDLLNPVLNEDTKDIYVTEQDVPVLLSDTYGTLMAVSQDGVFLFNEDMKGHRQCYCTLERYPDLFDQISSGVILNNYASTYYDYLEDKTRLFILTDEQKSVIDLMLDNSEPVIYSDGEETPYDRYYDHRIPLLACSEDTYFSKDLCDLLVIDGQYYLIQNDLLTTMVYAVPEGMTATMKEIAGVYIQYEDEWEDYMLEYK